MSASNASDDEMEWEDVVAAGPGDLVIEFPDDDAIAGPSSGTREGGKGKGTGRKLDEAEKARINAERQGRLASHKIHTVALIANARIRNQWLNDKLLHARLMSLTPLSLQNHFDMITKRNQPDQGLRGRQFEAAVHRLTDWWYHNFDVEDGPNMRVRSRTFAEVQQELREKGLLPDPNAKPDPKGKGKAKQISRPTDSNDEEDSGEIIRSSKSLMKHALMMRGSKDTSAQLFCALCRALGIPTRLVVSLQCVPWKTTVGKPSAPSKKKKAANDLKGKEKEVAIPEGGMDDDDDDDDMEEIVAPPSVSVSNEQTSTPPKGKAKGVGKFPGAGSTVSGKPQPKSPPAIHLRKSKSAWGAGRRLGEARAASRAANNPPQGGWPPVFWCEVFSRPDGRWIPVDPSRNLINRKRMFEPPPNDRNNRMLYVVGFEEDGYARDVTPRYANEFGAKTAKLRIGGTGKGCWWDGIMQMIVRPYRLNRDDIEDAELLSSQMTEAMPNSMAGFKNHPLYVLERHLRREQVVHPAITIGTFRGEPVYPRGNVVELKTAENWMRSEGREVKNGEQPMKMVKVRASTVRRKREVEVAMMEMADRGGGSGDEGVMQGLYADWQTKLYEPPPVIDGKVPKNDFGNIDLYTPTMLPQGGIHLPYKGIAKIARKLGMDHAEAVTGFEFKQRRAMPIITGIVVAEEAAEALLEAYWVSEHAAEEKERQKKQERVFKRWAKLVKGLRIRQRLLKEYSVNGALNETVLEVPQADDGAPEDEGGGFIVGAERDVVGRFSLPKMQHVIVSHAPVRKADLDTAPMEELIIEEGDAGPTVSQPAFAESAEDDEAEESPASVSYKPGLPVRSMAELAAEAEAAESSTNESRGESATGSPATYPLRTRKAGAAADNSASPATRAMARAKLGSASPAPSPGQTSRKRSRTAKSSLQTPVSRSRRRRKSSETTSEEEKEEESDLSNESDEEDDSSTGRKRPRRGTVAKAPAVEASPPAAGGRVLRARKGKTEEQLRAEKEQEKAFRRAIAD